MAPGQRAAAGDVRAPAPRGDCGRAHHRDAVREVRVQERAQGRERAAVREQCCCGYCWFGVVCEPAGEGGEEAGGQL